MSRRTNPNPRPTPPDPKGRKPEPARPRPAAHSVGDILREWGDALVIAFVATMFFRIFFVELFKIPSSSMTPTLIGGRIATVDADGDGRQDIILKSVPPLVFTADGRQFFAGPEIEAMMDDIPFKERYDRILVNKMSYWFHPPERGDIVVFKVPPSIWEKDKPIYIKRCVGLPGERLEFDGDGHLIADGRRVTSPEFFATQQYRTTVEAHNAQIPGVSYSDAGMDKSIRSIHVPPGQIYLFGDNTNGSFDSRYWGGVALDNVKGRAFFRYWPPSQMKFFKGS